MKEYKINDDKIEEETVLAETEPQIDNRKTVGDIHGEIEDLEIAITGVTKRAVEDKFELVVHTETNLSITDKTKLENYLKTIKVEEIK